MSQEILTALSRIESKLDRLLGSAAKSGQHIPREASEADLAGEHGDPVVRKDPPKWKGESCVGLPFSQCPPEFLDTMAGFKDWCAQKDEEAGKLTSTGKPAAQYGRLDAVRARGWAKRIRSSTDFPE